MTNSEILKFMVNQLNAGKGKLQGVKKIVVREIGRKVRLDVVDGRGFNDCESFVIFDSYKAAIEYLEDRGLELYIK